MLKEYSAATEQRNRTQERLTTVALPSCFVVTLAVVMIAVALTA